MIQRTISLGNIPDCPLDSKGKCACSENENLVALQRDTKEKASMPGHRRRGFTLIETLMSFFILGTAIVVTFSVMGQILKGTTLSESHMRAATVAHGLLNQERAVGFASVVPATATVTTSYTKDGRSYVQSMLYNVEVELLDSDTKRVKATVTWQESSGSKQVILQTVVGNL